MSTLLRCTTLALLLAPLGAQTLDTLGGTNTPVTNRANTAKASVFAVTTSSILLDYQMWLDVGTTQTVTFFLYRYHSRSGPYTLEASWPVTVTGGGGPGWVSTGTVAHPLLCGNYYMLGASWTGALTYYYNTSATGAPVSFGSWQRAHTLTNPIPATYNVASGHDSALYFQQMTTLPLPNALCVGSGCNPGAATLPRLVQSRLATLGTTVSFDLQNAPASSLAAYAFAFGPTMTSPITLFGCPAWINLGPGVSSLVVFTSSTGTALQQLAVPNNPQYLGTQLSVQAAVLGNTVATSNALEFSVN